MKRFFLIIFFLALVATVFFIYFESLKTEVPELANVSFTCPYSELVALHSDLLGCRNGFDLYCKDKKVVCLKDITTPQLVLEKSCYIICPAD